MDRLIIFDDLNCERKDLKKTQEKVNEIVDWISRQEEKWDDANEALKEFEKGLSKL